MIKTKGFTTEKLFGFQNQGEDFLLKRSAHGHWFLVHKARIQLPLVL